MRAIVEAEKNRLVYRQGDVSEKLEVLSGYPTTREAETIFQQFGFFSIISPHLPTTVRTNFPVANSVRRFIGSMYASEGKPLPRFYCPAGGNEQLTIGLGNSNYDALVTFTGGKDSLWNLMRAQDEYNRILAVHISGLNQSVASRERRYVEKQSGQIGFDLQIIEIKNSKSSRGWKMMRARNFFLTALAVPLAAESGASRIYLEGGLSVGEDEDGDSYSHRASAWESFNQILAGMGLLVKGDWYDDQQEMGRIRDLLERKPEWLAQVMNCLSMPVFVPGIRRNLLTKIGAKSERDFPLYETQCGGCIKCRTVNIARIVFDPEMDKVDRELVRNYLRSTLVWMNRKSEQVADFVDSSFYEVLKLAREKYDV